MTSELFLTFHASFDEGHDIVADTQSEFRLPQRSLGHYNSLICGVQFLQVVSAIRPGNDNAVSKQNEPVFNAEVVPDYTK